MSTLDVSDLRPTIVPKSDQLNAEQLLGGPITITVTEVRIGSTDQPILVHYEGENGRPFKPCKTMRKVLIFAWGPDGRDWVGKSMTLYNDPVVKFGGEEVGGIRISHLSDIDRDLQVSLTATKGKKALHVIKRMERGPSLAEVLTAITAATNKATMDAAKKLAEKLSNPADVTAAVGAYKTRAAALKAAAAPPPAAPVAPAKSLAECIADVDGADDHEAAQALVEAARAHLSADEHAELVTNFNATWEP